MVENKWFSQFLANIININTERPKILETTALGVAFFAGYQIGVFKSLDQIRKNGKKKKFLNQI
jgi:glycerol kinase